MKIQHTDSRFKYIYQERHSFAFILFILLGVACQPNEKENKNQENIDDKTTSQNDFESIFDGESLAGWEGDEQYWRVESGVLIGELRQDSNLNNNTFLIWQNGQPGDFELKTEYRISESGNSGINYRSDPVEDLSYALRGYQADIDGKNSYTGQNYEERKRTTLAYRGQKTKISAQEPAGEVRQHVQNNAWKGLEVTEELGDRDSLRTLIHSEDWNTMHLIIKGNSLKHYVNDVLMSEVIDEDEVNRKMEGLLGIQIHVGPPMKVEFRNISLKTN